jgi:hypothetical protein
MKFLLSSTVERDRLYVKPYKPFYSSGEPITITCDKPFEELYIISEKTGAPLVVPGLKIPFYGYPSPSTKEFIFTFPQIYGDEIYYFTTSQYQYSSDSFKGLKISKPQSYFKPGDTITISECTFKELYIVDVTTNYPILINGSYNIHKDATGNDINSETSSYVFTFPNFPSGKYYITSEYYCYSSRVFTYSNPGTLILSNTDYQVGNTIGISGSPFVELYLIDVITSNPVQTIPNPFYSGSEINEYEFVLPTLPNGNYFITTSYYAYSSEVFTVSTPTSFVWNPQFAFPIGGVGVGGGESEKIFDWGENPDYTSFEYGYTKYKESLWFTETSNLVRLPVVWAFKSNANVGEFDHCLFIDDFDPEDPNQTWTPYKEYLDILVDIVTEVVNSDKVIIIDMHTYGIWNGIDLFTTGGDNKLALIWGNILKVFDDYEIFQNKLVWFELINEPDSVNDFTIFQKAINQIRNNDALYSLNKPYTNKIIIELSAGGGFLHVCDNNNGNYVEGLSKYSESPGKAQFPTDSANNLCVSLHQYFNTNGSGNYNGNPMLDWNPPNLSNYLKDISTLFDDKCDFILGEFGYDEKYNQEYGTSAVTKLLDAMVDCNNENGFNPSNTLNILEQTKGGLWIGFAAWVISWNGSDTNDTDVNNYCSDAMYNSDYKKYFMP